MKGLGGSNETKTDVVSSRGLTPEDKACLVDGLNIASAIICQRTGQDILLAVPALRVQATDNSPALVLLNEKRRQEWEEAAMKKKREEEKNDGGLSFGVVFARLFAAVAVSEAGGTGKQVLNVLKSTGIVRSDPEEEK